MDVIEPGEPLERPEPADPARPRTIGRRGLIVGAAVVVVAGGAAGFALERGRGGSDEAGPPTSTSEPEPTGTGGATLEFPHDVARVPQDPATGVAGWPMDPAGAQLVQAPV